MMHSTRPASLARLVHLVHLVIAIALLCLTTAALAAPEPASIGIRTYSAEGHPVGGHTVRVTQLEGEYPQETLFVVTQPGPLVWRAVMPGYYEFVVLDDDLQPIDETALYGWLASGSHDNYVFLALPATCPGDVDADGIVDLADLLSVLAAWGPCGVCAQDVDNDGVVGFTDLVAVLAAWGSCS